jgi:hypothetical protein
MRYLARLALLLTVATISAAADRPVLPPTSQGINALSQEEIAALERGHGLGQGRAAELNHYPGPSNVLNLADELGLEPEQVQRLSAIEARMLAAAMPIGAQLLAQERLLEASFAKATAEPGAIRALSAAMAGTEAQLRAINLTAHFETRAVLTEDQLARYEYLQGYSDALNQLQPRG